MIKLMRNRVDKQCAALVYGGNGKGRHMGRPSRHRMEVPDRVACHGEGVGRGSSLGAGIAETSEHIARLRETNSTDGARRRHQNELRSRERMTMGNVVKIKRKARPLTATYQPLAPYSVQRDDQDDGSIRYENTARGRPTLCHNRPN